MTALLKVENIIKKFGELYANNKISFEVKKGEVLAILGEGCGFSAAQIRSAQDREGREFKGSRFGRFFQFRGGGPGSTGAN